MNHSDAVNRDAFSLEAIQAQDKLYNSAMSLTKNDEDAKDLLQDTYLTAFRFSDKYKIGSNINGWLYRIMKNIFINNYRKKKKQPVLIDYNDVEPFIESIKLNSDITSRDREKILESSLSDETTHALTCLPDEFREVLTMYEVEGFSYQEIADILEIPVGTVRSRLSRARKATLRRLSPGFSGRSENRPN